MLKSGLIKTNFFIHIVSQLKLWYIMIHSEFWCINPWNSLSRPFFSLIILNDLNIGIFYSDYLVEYRFMATISINILLCNWTNNRSQLLVWLIPIRIYRSKSIEVLCEFIRWNIVVVGGNLASFWHLSFYEHYFLFIMCRC